MRLLTLAVGLVLSISCFAQAVVIRPKAELTNRTCYNYDINAGKGEPEITELFNLDGKGNVWVHGLRGQLAVDKHVVKPTIFRDSNRGQYPDVHVIGENGKELLKGYVSQGFYGDISQGDWDNHQSARGIWQAGSYYTEGFSGQVICAPTAYGAPQRYPSTKTAVAFLLSTSVPKELAEFVSKNLKETKETLERRSELQTLGGEIGETVSDQITLRGSGAEGNSNCETAYRLSFNIFTKTFSAWRGRNCPESDD